MGHGLISARIINNTRLLSNDAGTLIVQTAANDNDWDGAANAGELRAGIGATLELRDVGAPFGFAGTVSAVSDGTVFANGFALDFNPGSTLSLQDGARYRSTSATDIGGTVTIGVGVASTIEVANNTFLTFESTSATTLNSNLRLVNNNINIEDGATFSGSGALIVPDGSGLVADNSADIGVLLDMQGTFQPGNSAGIARVDLLDYQQANTGELFVELTGTGLNQFDRLVVNGAALLDGYLDIDIDGGFVPVLGQTFNIVFASAGLSGTFETVDSSGMPAGLVFHVSYLPTAVQLQVVSNPNFAADFDNDGDVDSTDYKIWRAAYGLNQLGDANGDNISDAADYVVWRHMFGSTAPLPGGGSAGAPPSQMAVPEPSISLLCGLAIASLFRMRRVARTMAA